MYSNAGTTLEYFKQFLRNNALLILVLLLSAFLRILYLGHIDFDEMNYVTGAKHILAGVFDPNTAFPTSHNRYALMFFLAGYINLFGYSHVALVPITLIPALGSILVVYFLALKIEGKRTALIASFLLAIFPLNIKYSSMLEADIIISFFMGLCTLIYFYKKSSWSFFWIGTLIGVSFFIKFFNLLILLVLIIDLLRDKRSIMLFPLIIGFLIAILPFSIYQLNETGNPLFHITSLGAEVENFNDLHQHEQDYTFLHYLFNFLSKEPEPSLFNIFPFLFLIYLLFFNFKLKKYYFWFLWIFLGYFILEFHPTIPSIQRYALIIEIPLIIILATFCNKIKKQWMSVALYIALLSVSFYQLGKPGLLYPYPVNGYQELAYRLSELPPKNVYITSNNQVGPLTYYSSYKHNYSGLFGYHGPANYSFYDLHFVTDLYDIHDAYVLIDFRLIDEETDIQGYYMKNNGSLFYLREVQAPEYWILLYPLKYQGSEKPFGGVWVVK